MLGSPRRKQENSAPPPQTAQSHLRTARCQSYRYEEDDTAEEEADEKESEEVEQEDQEEDTLQEEVQDHGQEAEENHEDAEME